MRPIISWSFGLLLSFFLLMPLHAATQPNEEQVRQELKLAESNKRHRIRQRLFRRFKGLLAGLRMQKNQIYAPSSIKKPLMIFLSLLASYVSN